MSTDKPPRGRDIINNPNRFKRESNERMPSTAVKSISITLASPRDYHCLTEVPDGVTIATPPPPQKRSFGPIDNIDLVLNVELAKITGQAFATWLILKAGASMRSVVVDGNRNRIPEDDASAIDAIVRKVESQEDED